MSSSEEEDRAFRVLANAKRVLVGAGAGLSAAAGLNYADPRFFEPLFPGYREEYGIRGAYEGAFHPFSTEEELWAYWARHIGGIRYRTPAGQAYRDLLTLLTGKDYFILTTNVDGQFAKAGFDSQHLCTPQGDYSLFQCATPCSQEVYSNLEWTERALATLSDGIFRLPPSLIPRCPRCGGTVFPNLRKDGTFVEAPWRDGWDRLQNWQNRGGPLVLLELGVGFNTPGIIRYPFEAVMRSGGAPLIRINPDVRLRGPAAGPPDYFGLEGDLAPFLADWASRP